MTLEQYKLLIKQGDEDCALPENLDDLMKKNLKQPSLQQRWLKLFVEQTRIVEQMKIDIKELYAKLDYDYRFNKNVAWDGKSKEAQILGDPAYVKISRELEEQKVYLKYIEDTMLEVKSLAFIIRDYLSYKKMILGMGST